ncbi:AEC family transporter [Granulicella mallensis]|uniref:Putative permease n=1 Tax=Granulicella mallensis TaxID=940614 RepID=A0A7W7ZN71_9BACT|nr:AEC family transporter [Granulicella mallensis]MBB5063066.1 putative permease [Granulicella mallensis]
MTKVLANALVPIFFGLILGYVAGLRGMMDNQNIKTLITFVMSVAVPSSLFLAIARTPRAALREQASTALVLAIVYVVLYAVSFFWTHSREGLSVSDSSVVALTLGFPNVAAVGLPLLASVFGPRAAVTVATSIAIGSITVSPITLAILEGSRRDSGGASALTHIGISLIRSFKKPIVYAPLLGMAFSCAGLNLPSYVDRSFAVMGSAADGSALLLTGLVVSAQKIEIRGGTLLAVFFKNAIQPALAIGIAMLIHLSIDQMRYVTLISAMPCGFFGVVFGRDFDSSPRLASSSLIASYVIGVGTLAAWIVIVNHLG